MISLIIDTSTENSMLAFFENEKVLFEGEIPYSINSSKYIFTEIEKAIKTVSLELKDLSYIVVGKGPGSYTGTRVGVTIAKTLSFALNVPLISFCSLHSYVPEKKDQTKSFMAMIDARSGGAYFQRALILEDGFIQWKGQPQVASLEKVFESIEEPILIVTPNKNRLSDKVAQLFPTLNVEWVEQKQNAHYLNEICRQNFVEKNFDPLCEILYLK